MRQSKIQRYSLCNDVKDKKAAIHHKGRAWTCECFAFSLQTIVTVVNESPNNYALDICPGIKELLYYNTYDSANLLQPILHLDLLQQSYIQNNICVKIIYNSTVQYIPPTRPNSPLYLHQILPTHKYQPPKYLMSHYFHQDHFISINKNAEKASSFNVKETYSCTYPFTHICTQS